jgi:biopolymer transport protein ExbD
MKLSKLSQPTQQPSIDDRIMPLINVVFLLLIFFLVAGIIREPDPFEVTPPQSTAEAPAVSEALQIYVAADGTVALGDGETDTEALQARLAAHIADTPEALVRIVADRGADTVDIIAVMDVLRSAGVTRVKLATQAVSDTQ